MNKTIIVDCETTGLDINKDEILQLTIINDKGDILFNEYFKPDVAQSWEDTEAIHGITPDMVKDKSSLYDRKKEIQDIFDNAETIIGYNTEFDLDFIRNYKISINDKTEIVDVMRDFAEIYGEYTECYDSYKFKKLTFAADTFKFDWDEHHAHDSYADCLATLCVYDNLNKYIKFRDEELEKLDLVYISPKYENIFKKFEDECENINNYYLYKYIDEYGLNEEDFKLFGGKELFLFLHEFETENEINFENRICDYVFDEKNYYDEICIDFAEKLWDYEYNLYDFDKMIFNDNLQKIGLSIDDFINSYSINKDESLLTLEAADKEIDFER